MAIRKATAADAAAVAGLLSQLGYPDSEEAVAARLTALSDAENDVVLVATCNGAILGVGGVHMIPLLHARRPLARVTSFVVAEGGRRRGVGTALLAACEAWAGERGAERVEITSADRRADAHAFYEHLGYARQSVRLTRSILGD